MAGPKSAKARRTVKGRRRGNNHVPLELTIAREERAWALKVAGHRTGAIAATLKAEFGVSISTRAVNHALARVAERTIGDAERHALQYKGREIGSLLAIFEEAMDAWRRTIGPQVETTTREEQVPSSTAGAEPQVRRVVSTSQRTLAGDPRFLEKALEARRDLRKLLGLDAAVKVDVTNRDRPMESLTDEELAHAIASARAEKE